MQGLALKTLVDSSCFSSIGL